MNPGMPGRFITLVRRLAESGRLSSAGEYRELLDPDVAADDLETLRQEARRLADRVFGRGVYVRALVEITNRCRNNCLYCGIRCDNRALEHSRADPRLLRYGICLWDAHFRAPGRGESGFHL